MSSSAKTFHKIGLRRRFVLGRGEREICSWRIWDAAHREGIGEDCMRGCWALGLGVLTLLGASCLDAVAGERTGGGITFASETINSGGISFSSGGNIILGASIGQSLSTKPLTSANTSLSPGFWNQGSPEMIPSPTLFMFR